MEQTVDKNHKIFRRLVLEGEDMNLERRGNKKVVASSECRFHCKDSQTLDKCIQAIKESDEHLRSRPDELVMWDWRSTWVEVGNPSMENTVMLGVAWYDYNFFLEKKDVYLNFDHLQIFKKIGITNDNIDVIHWVRI